MYVEKCKKRKNNFGKIPHGGGKMASRGIGINKGWSIRMMLIIGILLAFGIIILCPLLTFFLELLLGGGI